MSWTLFKTNMKSNWGIFVFIVGMLMIYVSTAIAMFDPESATAMQAMFDMLPEGMIKAFGFVGLGTNLTTYLAGYLYGFILLVFPIIYISIVANNLIAKHVDRGSMSYILATPNTRIKVAMTQALYLIISLTAMLSFMVGVLIGLSEAIFPGHLEIGRFLVLNMVTLFIILAVSSISFLASCIFSDSKASLAFGAGIPIAFVLFKMLADISEKVDFFRYFSIYTLLNTDKVLNDNKYVMIVSLCLVLASAALYSLGVIIFNKKSLAI
ncbi:MAG: ABC transporter permease subunit [Eubacteriales bacterium]